MKSLIFLSCSVLAVMAVPVTDLNSPEWQLFKRQYNKTYENEIEERFRFKIFMDNKRKVEEHNARYKKGEFTFDLGLNKYSDMLRDEFINTMNGYKIPNRNLRGPKTKGKSFRGSENEILPKEINWVEKGAITPIKDQKNCGSCWAFSATGAMEAHHFIKTGKLVSLSEQNLVDCSKENGGCDGGFFETAFDYVRQNHGIDTEESYPYEAKNDVCRYNPANSGANVTNLIEVEEYNEEALHVAIGTVGPVSVSIVADPDSFLHYKSGIYQDGACGHIWVDHAVLVVGYGTDKDTKLDYWLIKNSWSESWGEKGYMRMIRGQNECGITSNPWYPVD